MMFLQNSCTPELEVDINNSRDIYVSTNIITREGTINANAEDYVKQVRVMVFDSGTGKLVVNVPSITFIQQNGESVWVDPIKITSGERDFFFVANEVTDDWNLTSTLNAVTHREQLLAEPNLNKILFKPDFKPTSDGTRAFIMTAVYRNVDVSVSGRGAGTQTNPYHFLSTSAQDNKVILIRTLAKLQLTLKNSSYNASTDRIEIGRDIVINSFRLTSIPQYFSLFANPYLQNQSAFFTSSFYVPITYYQDTGVDGLNMMNNVYFESINNGADLLATVYVPEFIRQRPSDESEDAALLGPAGAMSAELNLSYKSDPATVVQKRLSIDHADFNRTNDSYLLPDNPKTTYSRYSVLRNAFYNLQVSEREFILVRFSVSDWTPAKISAMMGYGYNITVDENNKVTISNTAIACAPHLITLKAVNGAHFGGGIAGDIKTFGSMTDNNHTQLSATASESYTLSNVPATGAYLEVYYNTDPTATPAPVPVKIFTK